MKLNNDIIKTIEDHDFSCSEINEQSGEYYIELSQYTPAGEDWSVCIWFDGTNKDFIKSIEKLVENFDIDEEVEPYIEIRGTRGVPKSVRTLIEDAEWKLETLQSLVDDLDEYLYETCCPSSTDVRKVTNKFIGLVEDHLLDPMDAIVMCAKWMSEDDIKEMCKANEIDLDMEDN